MRTLANTPALQKSAETGFTCEPHSETRVLPAGKEHPDPDVSPLHPYFIALPKNRVWGKEEAV